jgi:hypothetical protein
MTKRPGCREWRRGPLKQACGVTMKNNVFDGVSGYQINYIVLVYATVFLTVSFNNSYLVDTT